MRERKNKKGSGAAAAVVLVLALLSNLTGTNGLILLILLLAIGVICGAVYVIARAAKKAPKVKEKPQEPCEFGKANHEFSHDANRRLSQLEGFYKDGFIDRKEYELLKQRWSGN